MKCPNCQTENPDIAKFCKGCGAKLEAPAPVPTPTPEATLFCKSCGTQLKANAKFCAKCGTPTAVAPANATVPPKAPVPPVSAPVPPRTSVPPTSAPVPPRTPIPPTSAPVPVATPDETPEKKKAPIGIIILCVVIVLVAIAAVVLFKTGMLAGFGFGSVPEQNTEESIDDETTGSTETEEGSVSEEPAADDATLSSEELAQIMAPVDAVRDEGIALLESDDISGGISKLTTAMEQYVSILQTHGTYPELTANIDDAYTAYSSGVINHVNILYEQNLSSGLYEQMTTELTDAIALAEKINVAGHTVDASLLEDTLADLPANYKERYILAFNEFTERETWSRSECWGLMEDVPEMGLYDSSDLDDPLRLRYAYALAMITRKNNDNDIAAGNITPRDAGMRILESIEEMDYNPLLIQDAANYFKQAGENYTATSLQTLYDDLCSIIDSYEGLRIPKDIPWERFWYFNDFGEYSVDSTNGVSAECRQEIRNLAAEILSAL